MREMVTKGNAMGKGRERGRQRERKMERTGILCCKGREEK